MKDYTRLTLVMACLVVASSAMATEQDLSTQDAMFVKNFADDYANHYKCYRVADFSGFEPHYVNLRDQFGISDAAVVKPRLLCNPVSKNDEPVPNPDLHLVCYTIEQPNEPAPHTVLVYNQFGRMKMEVDKPELLCLPSRKIELD